MQFSRYISTDIFYQSFKYKRFFCTRIADKIFFIIRQPPALPCRLQHSTIGLLGLNHRVRDGYGCFPQAHRHRKLVTNFLITKQYNQFPYLFLFLRKEVIQPHLPIRLPCYDFTPVISPAFSSFRSWITDFGHYQLPWCDGRCVQDPGTYSPQHSDLRLLAIPASCSRVADYNPN